MMSVAAAILPVFLLILVGWAMKARGFPGDGFWGPVERLTYYALFPALIVVTLARADLDALEILPVALALIAALATVTVLLLLVRPSLKVDGPSFTSLVQGAIRMNTYICLAVAGALWGTAGLSLAAVAVAVIVPTVNVISVVCLARHGHGGSARPVAIARNLLRNPLVLASLLGIVLNVTGVHLPPVAGPMLEIMGQAALALGLLAVGAALDFRAARANGVAIAHNTVTKLAITPAITAGFLWLFGVEGMTAAVALLFMAAPTATSAYILARQNGGNAQLMAGIVTVQTAASVFTLPVVITLAG